MHVAPGQSLNLSHADASSDHVLPIRLPPLDSSFGALLLGTCVGLILLGFTIHQAYRYARTYHDDRILLKSLVALVVLLELASSVTSIHICYVNMVTNYFHPERVGDATWSSNLYPLTAGATMVVSQSFFAGRVWLLGPRYRSVVILSCLCSLAELALFAADTILAFMANQALESAVFESRVNPAAFYLAMAADMMLTASLIYTLHSKRTGFTSTNTTIDVLILYSVNTGLLNGIFDLLTATLALAYPHEFVYAAFGIPGTKLYAITLLAALHYRRPAGGQGSAQLHDADTLFGVSARCSAADTALALPSGRPSRDTQRRADLALRLDVIEMKKMSPSRAVTGDIPIDLADMNRVSREAESGRSRCF